MTAPRARPVVDVRWLGRTDYAASHAIMEQVLADRIAGRIPDTLLLVEHEPVFTLGRSRGAAGNVLDAGDVPVLPVRRGGDVTYHGPGQLTGYPIFALPEHRYDLHGYLRGLEQSIMATLVHYGIIGVRDERNTGVWVSGRKIAAIGIACRRWVTWHGFSINLDMDLRPFARINPCGMDSDLVTRIADQVSNPPDMMTLRRDVSREVIGWWRRWSAVSP